MNELQATFQAIGTHWNIRARTDLSEVAWEELLQIIRSCIDVFDKTYSRFRTDSLVSKMSQEAGSYELPQEGAPLLNFYRELYILTNGLVTPLIGQVIADAGYDATYSLKTKQPKTPPHWEDVIKQKGYVLTLKQPALLDFGAAGKGYLVDLVAEILARADIQEFSIDAGGDILHRSSSEQPIQVGLENPHDTSEVIGEVAIKNQSLCASAGSRRKWGKYHHIISPATLESPQDILATWVIADDTMTADGLATALFFVPATKLASKFRFSYAILRSSMSLEYSGQFPIKVYAGHEAHR